MHSKLAKGPKKLDVQKLNCVGACEKGFEADRRLVRGKCQVSPNLIVKLS